MQDKPHLSPSQIGMFIRCGVQWEFRYGQGLKIPPAVAMILGGGTDVGVSANLASKRDTGELLPLEKVQDITRDAVNEKWGLEGVRLMPEEEERTWQVVKGETVDTAVSLAGLHHARLAPIIQPAYIQREITVEIQGFPYDLMGILDIQEVPAVGQKVGRVRDTKCKIARAPSKGVADTSIQLTSYATMVKAVDGDFPELCLDFLVNKKVPEEIVQPTTRNEADYQAFFRTMELMALSIEKGVFHRADPDSWICSKRFCGYADRCKYYGGRP